MEKLDDSQREALITTILRYSIYEVNFEDFLDDFLNEKDPEENWDTHVLMAFVFRYWSVILTIMRGLRAEIEEELKDLLR